MLGRELDSAAGFASHEPVADRLVGQLGTTLTALRPAGKVRIDGQRLYVETEGDFIDRDVRVTVLRSEPGGGSSVRRALEELPCLKVCSRSSVFCRSATC